MKKTFALATLLLSSACASIVDGTKQEVDLQTSPVGCSRCELSNSKGNYSATCTPQKVMVKRAYGPLSVQCYGPNSSGQTEVESSVKGWFFGNILIGGLIGMGVDAATAAAWDYPQTIHVQMLQNNAYQPQGSTYIPTQSTTPQPIQAAPTPPAQPAPAYQASAVPTKPQAVRRPLTTTYGGDNNYRPLYQPMYPR